MASAADIQFRPASEADIASLVGMESRFYAGEGYPFSPVEARELLTRLLHEPERGRVWVAAGEDRLVGYLMLTFGYSIEFHGVDALVDELYLEPEVRGRGLGKQALVLAEATCIQLGIRSLHLEVERGNVPAQELYRKFGFKDHDRYLMTKLL